MRRVQGDRAISTLDAGQPLFVFGIHSQSARRLGARSLCGVGRGRSNTHALVEERGEVSGHLPLAADFFFKTCNSITWNISPHPGGEVEIFAQGVRHRGGIRGILSHLRGDAGGEQGGGGGVQFSPERTGSALAKRIRPALAQNLQKGGTRRQARLGACHGAPQGEKNQPY